MDQFEKFFIGGIDDMSGWVKRMWQQTVTMIEKGTRYGYQVTKIFHTS